MDDDGPYPKSLSRVPKLLEQLVFLEVEEDEPEAGRRERDLGRLDAADVDDGGSLEDGGREGDGCGGGGDDENDRRARGEELFGEGRGFGAELKRRASRSASRWKGGEKEKGGKERKRTDHIRVYRLCSLDGDEKVEPRALVDGAVESDCAAEKFDCRGEEELDLVSESTI